MRSHESCVVDNRDAQEMYGYLEARVDTLKRRIEELEMENEKLRALTYEADSSSRLQRST